jgi:hypothetical protein
MTAATAEAAGFYALSSIEPREFFHCNRESPSIFGPGLQAFHQKQKITAVGLSELSAVELQRGFGELFVYI